MDKWVMDSLWIDDEWTNGQMNGWMDAEMVGGWMYRQNKWIDGWMGGQRDERRGRQME